MRAAAESSRDSVRRVIEQLEPLDWSRPWFEGADRAAFLLADAYARSGSPSRLIVLGRQVERWESQSEATRWVVQRARLAALEQGAALEAPQVVGGPSADALAASARLRTGDAEGALSLLPGDDGASALGLAVRAQALSSLGRDDRPTLLALLTADTLSALGRDLADAARVTLATRAMLTGEDPSPWFEGRVRGGALAARAAHLEGVWRLERGETDAGEVALVLALRHARDRTEARAILGALGGSAMDRGEWAAAHARFAEAESSWTSQWEAIDWLIARGGADAPWAAWSQAAPGVGSTWLPGDSEDAAWGTRLPEATDLRHPFHPAPPSLSAASPTGVGMAETLPPTPEEWERLGDVRARAQEAQHSLLRARWALDDERATLAQLREYLGLGLADVRESRQSLSRHLARLDSLAATLTDLDERLRALRDAAILRVRLRAARVREEVASHRLWIAGMERLRVSGPDSSRMRWAPSPHPAPPAVLQRERAMADALEAIAIRVSDEAPARIAASYDRAWRLSLIDNVLAQRAAAQAALAWAGRIEHAVDSSLAEATSSDAERALRARLAPLERAVDSTQSAWAAARTQVVLAAAARTREAMTQERELLDYGLAASAYGASVRLARVGSPSDSASSRARDMASVDALDAALDDPEVARWREQGIEQMTAFLARHPSSAARAEMRFRLADLRMIEARQRFREQMAEYLKQPAASRRGALPLLDHGPALALYRRILAEDPSFEHTDATLFNAAMILADEGSDEARSLFSRLVEHHASSTYRQEALLRLGDMAFADGSLLASVPLYARSAEGPDASLRVMALYKMGWAHFNEDRFEEAAAAFGAVLDVYAASPDVARQADLSEESEAYLVHSLAGAGGAEAFTRHFAGEGARAYELEVLLALGQHFRRYGEFARAAEVDRTCMQRYPVTPEALTSAMRLVETRERENDAARAEAARLDVAPRFAPGSAWAKAQASDSLRLEGERFARGAWRSVAQSHHRAAREKGSPSDWSAARDHYRTLLATWPDDSDAATIQLHLGEAEARLGDPVASMEHYRAAERIGGDSIRVQAQWEQVAVADAWYERTRGTQAKGSDSLARAVRLEAAELLATHPSHPGAADLRWRRSQLAIAHGWNDEALEDLAQMVRSHPGDRRAPEAASQRAEALFRLERYDEAAHEFEEARALAEAAGRDTLASRAEAAIPVSWHRFAEAAVAADSSAHRVHAERFARVAHGWPDYAHADIALYRAGLAYLAAGMTSAGVNELDLLISRFPDRELARESRLQIPRAWEEVGQKRLAADGFLVFSRTYPSDSSAADAWLHAADLRAAAGDSVLADSLRFAYVKAHPGDHETALEVHEKLARAELLAVDADHPVSALLGTPVRKGAKPAPASRLADYLALARKHPESASRDLIAQVRFLQGEEAMAAGDRMRLTLPLKRSIALRQVQLDSTLVRYRRAADLGEPAWARASACRIGDALASFATALEQSERPADLKGDDRLAYEEVLLGQAQGFHVRAQEIWSELLRKGSRSDKDDPWVTRARASLWRGLGTRFFFQPEVEFPVVELRRTPSAAADDAPSLLRSTEER